MFNNGNNQKANTNKHALWDMQTNIAKHKTHANKHSKSKVHYGTYKDSLTSARQCQYSEPRIVNQTESINTHLEQ